MIFAVFDVLLAVNICITTVFTFIYDILMYTVFHNCSELCLEI